ncbi:MAG: malto-oligosyltrehalose synthase [Nitrospira sp.]|nr:malto-oligosyltrehalose synthase [Nitrospira sp.]
MPVSTYRLQLNRAFPFKAATAIVPYLSALGITDCYPSPYLKATPGSEHGYDVVDPTVLNPELGTEDEYREFIRSLHAHQMGHILDVVPNHMGIGRSANVWWLDVLENGPSSRYAHLFDIDWHPVKRELENKVLLPILGDLYGTVLENQEIVLLYEEGRFFIRYYDHRLPVGPKSATMVLTHRLDELIAEARASSPHVQELQSIVTALRNLPASTETDPERVEERNRERDIIRQRLATLVRDGATIARFLDDNVRIFNGTKGDPRSFDLLDALLDEQVYRLADWRVAAEEINYRRFFDINELAAVRMEDEAVLQALHVLVFRLVKEGAVTGLRIDHVDGLSDPGRYLREWQTWGQRELGRPLFVVVEKILGKDEPLPETWPISGTTGYDFLNLLNGLFVQTTNERAMNETYVRFIRRRISFEDLVYESKKLIMQASMASEINVLGHQLNQLSERDRRSRDFTLNSLTNAIREIIACFPVYRTYITEGPEPLLDRDRAYIRLAVARAKRRNAALSWSVFDFVRSLLLKEWDERTSQNRQEQLRFVMKFQQMTSPVTAKGIEDTAFYRFNRLVSLNEVGGNPESFGVTVTAFHKHLRERQARWPFSLSATSTHDTKRSEDARGRINVLSEIPREWRTSVNRWAKLTRKCKVDVEGQLVPDRNEEYLLYQTLVGIWPLRPVDDAEYRAFCDRIQGYMNKALREGKTHTSWINPDQAYEDAMRQFIDAILDRTTPNAFLDEFLPFQRRVAQWGMWNTLSQVVLKATAPGVPDFYQGSELWDFSLVDPDNRRPVDYEMRASILNELRRGLAERGQDLRPLIRTLLAERTDGRIKLYTTMRALNFRRENHPLFHQGEYIPLEGHGTKQDHCCAFARLHLERALVTVVPRLVVSLTGDAMTSPVGSDVWEDTYVTVPSWRPHSPYRNLFTGEGLSTQTVGDRQMLPMADVLREFPVALLERLT